VSISEPDSHASETLHVGSGKLNVISIPREILKGTGIPHTHVIRHHENYIGLSDFRHRETTTQRADKDDKATNVHIEKANSKANPKSKGKFGVIG
tara:strand:- start:3449 stop:3733 length:285 start_codon:yes stop_codon:yes gene_type:complete